MDLFRCQFLTTCHLLPMHEYSQKKNIQRFDGFIGYAHMIAHFCDKLDIEMGSLCCLETKSTTSWTNVAYKCRKRSKFTANFRTQPVVSVIGLDSMSVIINENIDIDTWSILCMHGLLFTVLHKFSVCTRALLLLCVIYLKTDDGQTISISIWYCVDEWTAT